jgi:PAS domain S-box-containing protein
MSAKGVTSSNAVDLRVSPAESAELLIASITDYAIYLVDPGGRVATWSPGAERMKGYAASEIVGRHFSVFYTVEDRRSGLPERELLATAQGPHDTEGWRVRKDGARFWANVSIAPVRDRAGTFLGYAKVTRDLTEVRGGAERLASQRVQEAMKIRDDVIRDARRELDLAARTIRTHLRSLAATLGFVEDETTAAMMAKVTTLEWSLDHVTRSMEKVVALADKASRLFCGPSK